MLELTNAHVISLALNVLVRKESELLARAMFEEQDIKDLLIELITKEIR